jgi:hypothetical protein|tara:strand:- start:285 stop:461 length:177 start_codon:yes stop_codon:yes gene_type:complete
MVMKSKEITFRYDKDTPNTIRFTEVVADGDTPVIGKLYVRKLHIEGETPNEVTVTVSG